MTRKKKLMVALAVSVLAGGAAAAIRRHRTKGPEAVTDDDRAKLGALIGRLREVERKGSHPDAEALRSVLEKLAKNSGVSVANMPAWLGRLRGGGEGLTDEMLVYLESQVEIIEEAAGRKGM